MIITIWVIMNISRWKLKSPPASGNLISQAGGLRYSDQGKISRHQNATDHEPRITVEVSPKKIWLMRCPLRSHPPLCCLNMNHKAV